MYLLHFHVKIFLTSGGMINGWLRWDRIMKDQGRGRKILDPKMSVDVNVCFVIVDQKNR